MKSIKMLCLLIVLSQSGIVLTRYMNFTATNTSFNRKYLSNITTWTEDGLLNIEMTTVRVLEDGLRGNIAIQYKIQNSPKYQTLFSYDFDLCKLLNEMFNENLLRTWFRNILKYGNLMENCPVPVDSYHIHKLRLESNSIPSYLRAGDYRFNVLNYYGKRKTKSFDMVSRFLVDMRFY